MPFIGNQPAESYSAFQKQDFSTSATTSYTLDHPVSNQNEIALFINFVRQEPTAAYTASGTSLTLTSATSSSDDMYCVYLGKAVQTVNPPSGSVGSSQVSADLITGQTALGATPADTDELLISDAGTLKRVDYSYLKSGITQADFWRFTGSTSTSNTRTVISADLERSDSTGFGYIGSGMTQSSGIFTFPSTGIYYIAAQMNYYSSSTDSRYVVSIIQATTDNSSYDVHAFGRSYINVTSGATYTNAISSCYLDVTDTSNVKVKFLTQSENTASISGSTDQNETFFTFIRLGDT